jgi:putative FmdB family regulatory protein
MPVYEYACQKCGHEFEEWQKMSDPAVSVCPKCKAKKVERLISRTSFHLKGGGWYGDLYASAKPGASSGGDSSASSSSEASSSSSSGEASSAAASESKTSTKDAKGTGGSKGTGGTKGAGGSKGKKGKAA